MMCSTCINGPYNPDESVVCVDEKSKQLLAHNRTLIAHKPDALGKEDYERERKGTRDLFIAVESLAGWRQVVGPQHCKKADFVTFVRKLLTGGYRLGAENPSGVG